MARKTKEKEEVKTKTESGGFSFKEVIIIALLAIIFGLLLGSLVVFKKYNSKDEIKDNSDSIKYIYNSILSDYYGESSKEDILDGAIEGMIGSLNDKYAVYLKPDDALKFNQNLNGNYIGLGVTIAVRNDNKIEIIDVNEGSPAMNAGMMAGDIIISMDGTTYDNTNYNEMINIIKSSKNGSKKTFDILRNNETITLTATLDKIDIESVGSIIHSENDKKVGIIKIVSFSSNTYSQFLQNYKELEKEGIDSLIIDVRDNSGGYLSTAQSIASHFVNKGTLLYMKTNGKTTEKTFSEIDKDITVPIVLLINQNTASSAEVFVTSLYENLNIDIVGVTSYGKGTVQKLITLNNGAVLKYTVYEWLTSKGNKIDGIGVNPTKEVKQDNSDIDVQLQEAIKIALSK